MAKLEGAITVSGLPSHRGLIASLCFYRVEAADAPAPFGGDPPAEAATDCHEVVQQVDLNTESSQPAYDLPFSVERPIGFYYLQVRAILFRTEAGQVVAQAEQFFFGRRPVHFTSEPEGTLTLPVSWPTQTLEELQHYGTVSPQRKRPWWRFW
jgi:hypothetical protein